MSKVVKYVCGSLPFQEKFRLFWERVTFSKITVIYFVFSILHCFIQVVFQAQAFTINASATSFLTRVIEQGNATGPGFPVLGPDLRWCSTVPTNVDASSCPIVWKGSNNVANSPPKSAADNIRQNSSSSSSTGPETVSAVSPFSSISSLAPSSTSVSSSSSTHAPSLFPDITLLSATGTPTATVQRIQASPSAINNAESITVVALPIVSSKASSSSAPSSSGVTTLVPFGALAVSSSASKAVSSTFSQVPTKTVTEFVQATQPAASKNTTKTDDNDGKDSDDDDKDDEKEKRDIHSPFDAKVFSATDNGQQTVTIQGLDGFGNITVDQKCLMALNWPISVVENTKREDIVFICFQIWVLAMSLVALLNESIPHIFASLLTHILATAWGGFQIANTSQFRSDFARLTTNGACGVNLLPSYWKDRGHAELPSLILNIVALFISAYLTWRLMKLFGWQTFKRVGASLTINRVYNVVLVLSIVIQLSLFFIVVSGALWIDQISNGKIGKLTTQPTLFRSIMVVVLILLLPWLMVGWHSVRRESRVTMVAFLFLSLLYLAGWGAMFAAPTFRWTFVQWRFFSVMASASVFLTLVSLILGIVCRVNFGKGLSRYLNDEEPIPDDHHGFAPQFSSEYYDKDAQDIEKVDYPNLSPVPTFSATFGRAPEITPLPQLYYATPQTTRSPFADPALPNPFDDPQSYGHTRSLTVSSQHSTHSNHSANSGYPYVRPDSSLSRQGSSSSQKSYTSTASQDSTSGRNQRSKRWIIE